MTQPIFYLVSMGSADDGDNFWKWGITTKATAKKRSSDYYDVHRWVEIPSMAYGRAAEKLMGCLMVNVVNDRAGRSMYTEYISQAFPFEVLLQMFDWVVENVDKGTPEAKDLYYNACPGYVGYEDAAPAFALGFRALVLEAEKAVKVEELVPMWGEHTEKQVAARASVINITPVEEVVEVEMEEPQTEEERLERRERLAGAEVWAELDAETLALAAVFGL